MNYYIIYSNILLLWWKYCYSWYTWYNILCSRILQFVAGLLMRNTTICGKILHFVVKHSILWYNITFLCYFVVLLLYICDILWYICCIFCYGILPHSLPLFPTFPHSPSLSPHSTLSVNKI